MKAKPKQAAEIDAVEQAPAIAGAQSAAPQTPQAEFVVTQKPWYQRLDEAMALPEVGNGEVVATFGEEQFAFRDADSRIMIVVETKDGMAKMPVAIAE